jgi:hypothetical protein
MNTTRSDILEYLSTRELQAYGALCLNRFCRAQHISHRSIDELLDHLLALLVSTDFSQWETAGAKLTLSNRGFVLPEAIDWQLSDAVRADFCAIVGHTHDIGFADVYGAETRRPLEHLRICLAILDRHGVSRPLIDELFPGREPIGTHCPTWGHPLSAHRAKQVRAAFRFKSRAKR